MTDTKRELDINLKFLGGLYLGTFSPQSRYSESFRSLRTNLHFSFAEGEFQSILVTSTGPEEGKSTVSANLAHSLAQSDRRVLMLDADMRKPRLSELRPSLQNIGLSHLISNVLEVNIESGTLSEYGPSDLLWIASFQKRTGVLQLTENDETVKIYIKKGEMTDVHWVTRPEDQRLATLLVKNNFLSKEQIKDAFLHQQSTKQKLGFILLSMGYIKKEDLSGFLRIHLIESLRVALRMKEGSFKFETLPLSFFEKPLYTPEDLPDILQKVIIGEEETPFLTKLAYSSIARTDMENLFLMPCGPIPKNPAELLSTKQMSFFLSFLKRRFDFIVIDSPPILPASDALILAPKVDGVLLVVQAGKTNRQLVRKSIEQLQMSKSNLLGLVLNKVDYKKEGYYKYYSKYYGKTE